jgi:hypothetical protein
LGDLIGTKIATFVGQAASAADLPRRDQAGAEEHEATEPPEPEPALVDCPGEPVTRSEAPSISVAKTMVYGL